MTSDISLAALTTSMKFPDPSLKLDSSPRLWQRFHIFTFDLALALIVVANDEKERSLLP